MAYFRVEFSPGLSSQMVIHYMTPRGTQDAWVGNELRVVARAGIPFELH